MSQSGRHRRVEPFGFAVWTGSVGTMSSAHSHSDLELNYCFRGSMTYLWQDRLVKVEAHHLAAFWAACAHQVVDAEPNTRVAWATLPLEEVARRPGIEKLAAHWLSGAIVRGKAADPLDEARFRQWSTDLAGENERLIAAARAEVEARLMRLACEPHHIDRPRPRKVGQGAKSAQEVLEPVVAMAAFIAARFDEPIRTADVARHVSLHPNYAMTLFKQHVGVTITDYLTQQRLACAQRLLITTDLPTLDVGLACGFGSTSRFYEAFKRQTGEAPAAYRARRRLGS